MNVGFDAKRYFHNRTGLGNYSRDLVDTLASEHLKDKFFLFDSNPEIDHLPSNVIAVPPGLQGAFGKPFWRPYLIRRDMEKYLIDVYHGLSNELPYGKYSPRVKKVVTIHDVIFKRFPSHYKSFDRWVYNKKTAHAIEIADKIIATSKATADDLMEFYKADPSKLEVVYQTCGAGHRRSFSESEIVAFRNKHKIPANSFLYLSSFQTRKNHMQLLKAYRQYKGTFKLVLAGRAGETLSACKQYIADNSLTERVLVLDQLSNSDLPYLYRSCSAFVYPSMIEGFGIPLIEAANAGLPMAVNDIPIFRELAPEGSLYFRPEDERGFAKILDELSQRSKTDYSKFLEAFDPKLSAAQVYEIYKRLI